MIRSEMDIKTDRVVVAAERSLRPVVVITQPPNNVQVVPNQPFLVLGQASNQWPPQEEITIESVTVQVDGGPQIDATVTLLPSKTMTVVAFKAFAQVTGGQDPHAVTVTAINDQGFATSSTVFVFAGEVVQVDSPAVLLDLSPMGLNVEDRKSRAFLDSLVSQIQYQLTTMAASLSSIDKVLAGPNIIFVQGPQDEPVGRFGLWVEDRTFPIVQPAPPAFPLPRLTDLAATKGFDTVPLLSIPNPAGAGPAFALSIPVKTLQTLLDSITPMLKAAASNQGASLDSVTLSANSPASITTSFTGCGPLYIPFSVTVTESLGIKQMPDSIQMVPAVIGSSRTASFGGIPDWFGFFGSAVALFALIAADIGSQVENQVTGIMGALLAGIPANVPFHNPNLPDIPMPDFPNLALNWQSLGVDGAAVTGTGTTNIAARDQSMVSVAIRGAHHITGYQEDLAGGTGEGYSFALVNLDPDLDKFKWQVSGTGTDSGSIERSPLDQSGRFDVFFPLPQQKDSHGKLLPVKPGKYQFTLTVNAIETSGLDPKKTLTASNSIPVMVEVKLNPQTPP